MTGYRRAKIEGATYFFTVNCADRQSNHLLTSNIDVLRQIFRIRDDQDFERHVDYIHWNPVKHGWVKRVRDWPHSSFHAYVRRGIYPTDWACDPGVAIDGGE